MDIHLQMTIAAQIERGITIDGLRLALAQILHHHTECLLVGFGQLWLTGVCDTLDARRQYIVDRTTVVVLLDIDRTHLQRTAIRASGQRLLIDTPLTTYQVERTKAQHDRFLELGQEHTHKTDAGEVGDAAHTVVVLRERDAELIPPHLFPVTITQGSGIFADVGNEVTAQLHILRAQAHLILEITLILVESIVLINVLHVRIGLVRGIITFRLLVGVGRVTLWHVDALIAVENTCLLGIKVAATEIVVVIVGRVGIPGSTQAVVDVDAIQEVGIGWLAAFFLVRQAVQSHILLGASTAGRGKGVCLGGLYGYLTPGRILESAGAVDRHTALVELLAIAQHILADLTEIDIQVTTIVGGIGLL